MQKPGPPFPECPRGEELAAVIWAGICAGRDGYTIQYPPRRGGYITGHGEVAILDFTAGSEPGLVNPMWLQPVPEPVRLADVPLLDYVTRWDEICPHRSWYEPPEQPDLKYADARRRTLRDAYTADIREQHPRDVFGRRDRSDRHLRERIADGRKLLAAIGAFPWACYGPSGYPAPQWHSDQLARAAWWHWNRPPG